MIISVVMCTYNGEKYITEQLDSIYNQIRQPDEVIIQDDKSTDDTVRIIDEYILKKKISSKWHLSVNNVNLGWKKNFIDALKKASGDLIFFADQDDIWENNKISIMADICYENSMIELLVSKYRAYDDLTNKYINIYQPRLGNGILSKVNYCGAFAECKRPGCTYAMRRELIQYIDCMWKKDWPHDQFFWCVALARESLFSLNRPLVNFRRHSGNNTPSNEKNSKRRSEILYIATNIAESILEHEKILNLSKDMAGKIEKSCIAYRQRADAVYRKDFLSILFLVRKIAYYPRIKAWFGDILAALN